MNATLHEPVRQAVQVPVTQDRAFEMFTKEASQWWPLRTHSIAGESATEVFFELQPGGRVYEVDSEGAQHEWGRVLDSDPPHRIVLSWYPGHPRSEATEVEIRFIASGDGSTTVELEHRDWEKLGDRGAALRKNYDRGWLQILGLFSDHARIA